MNNLSTQSKSVVDELVLYDNRIRVIYKNELSIIDIVKLSARGNYVTFVNANDFLERDFIKSLVNILNKDSSDIVIGDYYTLDVASAMFCFHISHDETTEILSSVDAISRQWHNNYMCLWGKLYHFDLLKQFVSQTECSERTILRQLYFLSQKITYFKTNFYCRRTNLPSNTIINLKAYYTDKINEYYHLLSDFSLLGLETNWIEKDLKNLLCEAENELKDIDPIFSNYLRHKLAIMSYNSNNN